VTYVQTDRHILRYGMIINYYKYFCLPRVASQYCALQIAVADFFRSFLNDKTFAVNRFVVASKYTVSASAHQSIVVLYLNRVFYRQNIYARQTADATRKSFATYDLSEP